MIALFEAGKIAFATTYEYDQEFTLTIYWGDFLLEYAWVAYKFNAPEILQEAESKLLVAKEKGRGFYSRPYLSLAKVALKLGDKQKCLDILQECKKVFTTDYYEYDFSDVLKNEDFREVWADVLPVPAHAGRAGQGRLEKDYIGMEEWRTKTLTRLHWQGTLDHL